MFNDTRRSLILLIAAASVVVEAAPQSIETRIGTLEFTHDFANGYPTEATLRKLYMEPNAELADFLERELPW